LFLDELFSKASFPSVNEKYIKPTAPITSAYTKSVISYTKLVTSNTRDIYKHTFEQLASAIIGSELSFLPILSFDIVSHNITIIEAIETIIPQKVLTGL